MRVPVGWLKDFVSLRMKASRLADELTMKGIEVDSVQGDNPRSLVLDLNIPSNRGDLLSMRGVAREIFLLGCGRLKTPGKGRSLKGGGGKSPLSVSVETRHACPLYTARVISGVKVGPSPDFIVRRLEAAGLRSINNIVDATNYVMLESGQPLHAFDASRLRGMQIHVRHARDGEILRTLDGSRLSLTPDDLVIADAERAVALAGIVGGEESGVSPQTERIVLESAWFDPAGIRRTRRRVGVSTESSTRFERAIDPSCVRPALDAVTSLVAEISGGTPEGDSVQVGRLSASREVHLLVEDLDRWLGVKIPFPDLFRLLRRLGLLVKARNKTACTIRIPTYRNDLALSQDLAEEVVRLWGLDRIPEIFPELDRPVPPPDRARALPSRLKVSLKDLGFTEVMHYNFVSERDLQFLVSSEDPAPPEIANPMSIQERFLRPTLLAGLLGAAARNQANQIHDLKLFEVGTVYHQNPEGRITETHRLAGLLVGARDNAGMTPKPVPYDFFDLKGVFQTVLRDCGVVDCSLQGLAGEPWSDPAESCRITSGECLLGIAGRLARKVTSLYEVSSPAVYYFDLNLDAIEERVGQPSGVAFRPPGRYPPSLRDLAVVVSKEVPADDLLQVILKCKGVQGVEIFDCYEGRPIETGFKSLAFHIRYGSEESTLTDDEINGLHTGVVGLLEKRFGAKLR